MGEKLEAVRYLQDVLKVNPEHALQLAEKLDEEEYNEKDDLRQKFNELKVKMENPPSAKFPRTIGLIFMGIGIIMLTIAIYLVYSDYQFTEKAISVTGEVLSYDSYYSSDSDGGGSTMYTPTFSYSYNGKEYTYTSSTSSSSPDFKIGEAAEILVDPDNPSNVLVNSFWERYLISVILGFLGAMFSGLGYMTFKIFG
jgi:hypothetical protein